MKLRKRLRALVVVLLVTGCDDGVFTLYRSSSSSGAGGDAARLHVATFNANEGSDYNRGNCEVARELFQKRSGVTVRYWCEKGRFKP